VQATPEFLGIFQNSIFGAKLDVADHPTRKVLVNQRADRRTGAAVETFKRRIISMFGEFLGKLRVYQCHFFLPGAIMASIGQFVFKVAPIFFGFLDFAVFFKGRHVPERFRR
jgi:hypothetical protein